jgi:hypothetical protein
MATEQISKEQVLEALVKGSPKSLSALYRLLGGKGNVSGSTAKRIRELVPDIEARLGKGKEEGEAPSATQKQPKAAGKVKGKAKSALSNKTEGNPFRPGSGYAQVYDLLAAAPKGVSRQDLIARYAKASRKKLKLAGYDVSVVISAKDSPTGPRHRSCREGFWVERENDFLKLRTR